MSLDAVALLRIPSFTPPEELDVRELDDGFLLFLDVPFEDDPDAILDAVVDAIGDALAGHDDERGLFVLPDAAEPEGASTYDDVIAAVGDAGMFIAPDDEGDEDGDALPVDVTAAAEAVIGQMFEALGAGSVQDLARALETGDQDALKMAQVRMMGAMERAMTPAIEAVTEPVRPSSPGDASRPSPAEAPTGGPTGSSPKKEPGA
jgi:hypothetical protein